MADRDSAPASAEPLLDRLPDVDDWASRASSTVVQYVGTVRSKTTGPALSASRILVYALAMGLISLVVAVLALILLIRLLVVATELIPGVDPGETWAAYFIIGTLFMIPGLFLWRRKER